MGIELQVWSGEEGGEDITEKPGKLYLYLGLDACVFCVSIYFPSCWFEKDLSLARLETGSETSPRTLASSGSTWSDENIGVIPPRCR